jgi:hypothetical protein
MFLLIWLHFNNSLRSWQELNFAATKTINLEHFCGQETIKNFKWKLRCRTITYNKVTWVVLCRPIPKQDHENNSRAVSNLAFSSKSFLALIYKLQTISFESLSPNLHSRSFCLQSCTFFSHRTLLEP